MSNTGRLFCLADTRASASFSYFFFAAGGDEVDWSVEGKFLGMSLATDRGIAAELRWPSPDADCP